MSWDIEELRNRPREQGKAAYREGMGREANPYPPGCEESVSWFDGWLYEDVHYPRDSNRKVSPWEIDPDCRTSEIEDWRKRVP